MTAKSAVWALVDVKDGTVLADEVVALDSANEVARATARSVQAFALQSQRDIDGVRLVWNDDARAHGIRLRTKLRLFGFDTVETVTQEAARDGRNRTARHIAPHLVLAYGAARADVHGDEHRNALARLVSRVPLPVSAAAGVIAVAGIGIYALTGGFTASAPVVEASSPAPAPAAAPAVPAPVPVAAPAAAPVAASIPEAARETFTPVESAQSYYAPAVTDSEEDSPAASSAAANSAATPVAASTDATVYPAESATVPQVATAREPQQPTSASIAAVGITPSDPQTIGTMTGEPHLTGSQLAAGPVQAVVAPAPAQSAPANSDTPGALSNSAPNPATNGPLSAFLEALP
ncbi:MAG: hypothetical protein PGN37_06085 [Mycobacterium kyogaense]|uniref:hypothetical protein n=1 Tax=Mycobacterium kyogaense TaxID=2212479 RepID=UPI002FF9A365